MLLSNDANKRVNLVASNYIRGLSDAGPIRGVVDNIELSVQNIFMCLCDRASVEEILDDGSLLKLGFDNYNKDNNLIIRERIKAEAKAKQDAAVEQARKDAEEAKAKQEAEEAAIVQARKEAEKAAAEQARKEAAEEKAKQEAEAAATEVRKDQQNNQNKNRK